MSFLSDRKKKVAKRPPLFYIYGVIGSGKTSFGAAFKDSCMVYGPGEKGIEDLINAGKVPEDYPAYPVESWDDLKKTCEALATEDHPHKRVFFDSTSEFQRLLFEHIVDNQFNGSQKTFDAYGAGYKAAEPEWCNWLTSLEALRDKGISPFLLGHARAVTFADPQREAYQQWQPDLQDSDKVSIYRATLKIVSELGFLDYETHIKESAEDRKGVNNKGARAAGGSYRNIQFTRCAAYEAKTKLGLTTVSLGDNPEEGYQNFLTACKEAKTGASK